MLLEKSRKSRAVAATKCNERSSRSHAVFRLKITGKNSLTSEACEGGRKFMFLFGASDDFFFKVI